MPSKTFQMIALIVSCILVGAVLAVMGIDLQPTAIPGFGV